MRAARVLLFACALGGCKQRPVQQTTPASAAVSEGVGLTVLSEVAASGLRVRSGTLAARTGVAGSAAAPWGFSELELDLARVRLEVVVAPGGGSLEKLLPEGGLAVVNGGYFEADFRPSTWLVSGGVELAKKSDPSKGGVLAVRAGQSYVGPLSGLRFQPSLAVQSFPLIVEPDGKPGVHRDDGRRAARTVACLVGPRLHFIVLTAPRGEGPTLYEATELLRSAAPRGFGCRAALNLDGGPSAGVWFSPRLGARQRAPLAHVAYALAVLPR